MPASWQSDVGEALPKENESVLQKAEWPPPSVSIFRAMFLVTFLYFTVHIFYMKSGGILFTVCLYFPLNHMRIIFNSSHSIRVSIKIFCEVKHA